jgi:trans-aconitate 2-methyltransferase
VRWDPLQYRRFADHRDRPFHELVIRVGAEQPRRVVDLGCGTGELTLTLARRWPQAEIVGLDSSAEMIERAPSDGSVRFAQMPAESFSARGVDVLLSNAMLQWVPRHQELLIRWADQLEPGGWLAFQVPGNFGAPSHRLMRELAESALWAPQLAGVLRHGDAVAEPADYLDLFASRGWSVDAWQTEYEQVLDGPDPVLEWVRGTGLRPVLAALDGADGARFEAEYAAALRRAYPPRAYGTVFGFRRIFCVAHKPAS